jgi:hypothetical protein
MRTDAILADLFIGVAAVALAVGTVLWATD